MKSASVRTLLHPMPCTAKNRTWENTKKATQYWRDVDVRKLRISNILPIILWRIRIAGSAEENLWVLGTYGCRSRPRHNARLMSTTQPRARAILFHTYRCDRLKLTLGDVRHQRELWPSMVWFSTHDLTTTTSRNKMVRNGLGIRKNGRLHLINYLVVALGRKSRFLVANEKTDQQPDFVSRGEMKAVLSWNGKKRFAGNRL